MMVLFTQSETRIQLPVYNIEHRGNIRLIEPRLHIRERETNDNWSKVSSGYI